MSDWLESILWPLLRASLALSVSCLIVWAMIQMSRCSATRIERLAWLCVLVQVILFMQLPVRIPWPKNQPVAESVTSLNDSTYRDDDSFAVERPTDEFGGPNTAAPVHDFEDVSSGVTVPEAAPPRLEINREAT